jgi:hypothetical protein
VRLYNKLRRAERYRAFGERSIDGVFGPRAESNPFVTEAGSDAILNHRLQHAAAHFEADAVQKFAARTHFLKGAEIAAL